MTENLDQFNVGSKNNPSIPTGQFLSCWFTPTASNTVCILLTHPSQLDNSLPVDPLPPHPVQYTWYWPIHPDWTKRTGTWEPFQDRQSCTYDWPTGFACPIGSRFCFGYVWRWVHHSRRMCPWITREGKGIFLGKLTENGEMSSW